MNDSRRQMRSTHTLEIRSHGRYLVRRPSGDGPWPLAVGFHGYAETAEINLAALERIPGSDDWLLAAVQAPHPFYTREQRVVANWMTRQDRELAIADNVDYVGRVLAAVRHEHPTHGAPVFIGFSQGGAMAYRAAAHYPAAALIILAADLPPDVIGHGAAPLPPVLIGRGEDDKFYSAVMHAADEVTLRRHGVVVDACVFPGGHEWGEPFLAAAGHVLGRVREPRSELAAEHDDRAAGHNE